MKLIRYRKSSSIYSFRAKTKNPYWKCRDCGTAILMDSQAQLVVRDQDNNYLLLETPSKKLLLPSTRVGQDEDFHAAALRYTTEVLRYSDCTVTTH